MSHSLELDRSKLETVSFPLQTELTDAEAELFSGGMTLSINHNQKPALNAGEGWLTTAALGEEERNGGGVIDVLLKAMGFSNVKKLLSALGLDVSYSGRNRDSNMY